MWCRRRLLAVVNMDASNTGFKIFKELALQMVYFEGITFVYGLSDNYSVFSWETLGVNFNKKTPQGAFKDLELPGKLASSVVTSYCTSGCDWKVQPVESSHNFQQSAHSDCLPKLKAHCFTLKMSNALHCHAVSKNNQIITRWDAKDAKHTQLSHLHTMCVRYKNDSTHRHTLCPHQP